jgi:hypothetical protein
VLASRRGLPQDWLLRRHSGEPHAAGACYAQPHPAVLRLLHGLGATVVGALVQAGEASSQPVRDPQLALHAVGLRINRSTEYRLLSWSNGRHWVPLVCLPLPLPLPCRLRKNIMPACAEFLSSHLDPQHGLDRLAYLVHS